MLKNNIYIKSHRMTTSVFDYCSASGREYHPDELACFISHHLRTPPGSNAGFDGLREGNETDTISSNCRKFVPELLFVDELQLEVHDEIDSMEVEEDPLQSSQVSTTLLAPRDVEIDPSSSNSDSIEVNMEKTVVVEFEYVDPTELISRF